MNAVSIPAATLASLPQPMKSGAAPASSHAAGESGFKGQLKDAIQERKGRSGEKDSKQGDASKKEIPKPPIIVAVTQPTPPPPPPTVAGFGLPSAGVEAGGDAEAASNEACAVDQIPIDKPAPDINAPAPPPETAHQDPTAGLAFALRLADLTPDREIQPLQSVPKTDPSDPKTAQTVQQPVLAPQVVLLAPAAPQPAAEATPAMPVKSLQPFLRAVTPTPVIAAAQPHDEATAESGSRSSDAEASPKETPKHLQPQPATNPRSFQQASAAPEAVSSVSREIPPQTLSPTTPAATPATPARAPSAATATIPVEHVSIPLAPSNPTSHVTDVSVNIQVPRADASGDDRVAIRMMQKGSEIHVTVRTPDIQLAQSLRQDLGNLTTGLDQGGFRTETWRPAATAQTNTNHQPSQDNPARDRAGSNARSGGNNGQPSGEQRRKQQDDRPRWVAELEQQKNR